MEDYREIYKVINDNNYNLVAYCVTPWQAKGAEAAIDFLSETREIRPLILLAEHGFSGVSVTKDHFSKKAQGYRIESVKGFGYFETPSEKKNQILRIMATFFNVGKDPIYIVNAGVVVFKWATYIRNYCNRSVSFVWADDGLGSYIGYHRGDPLWSPMSVNGIAYKLCIGISKIYGRFFDMRLYGKKHGKVKKNNFPVKYYRDVLERGSAVSEVDFETINVFSDCILLNGTVIDANYGENVTNPDIDVYRILSKILKNRNNEVVVKPHPRDKDLTRYDSLGWKVYDKATIPQEELIPKLEKMPKCIISLYSSTITSLFALYGIKSISLAKMMVKADIEEEMKESIQRMIDVFDDVISVPKDESELISALKNVN